MKALRTIKDFQHVPTLSDILHCLRNSGEVVRGMTSLKMAAERRIFIYSSQLLYAALIVDLGLLILSYSHKIPRVRYFLKSLISGLILYRETSIHQATL
jgi:hypothetical protein